MRSLKNYNKGDLNMINPKMNPGSIPYLLSIHARDITFVNFGYLDWFFTWIERVSTHLTPLWITSNMDCRVKVEVPETTFFFSHSLLSNIKKVPVKSYMTYHQSSAYCYTVFVAFCPSVTHDKNWYIKKDYRCTFYCCTSKCSWQVAATGRAHCQWQVAFLNILPSVFLDFTNFPFRSSPDGVQTTDRKWCIWAQCATCTGGLKFWGK